jgi:hypothetical protein
MLCAPGLIFGGIEGVQSRFHVLRARINFRRYRGRRVPFSCFALPDSFSVDSWASCPVFMFCAPGLIFGGTDDVGSLFQIRMKLYAVMRTKYFKSSINMFKQLFLMHLTYVLCNISVVEYSYRCFNSIIS